MEFEADEIASTTEFVQVVNADQTVSYFDKTITTVYIPFDPVERQKKIDLDKSQIKNNTTRIKEDIDANIAAIVNPLQEEIDAIQAKLDLFYEQFPQD